MYTVTILSLFFAVSYLSPVEIEGIHKYISSWNSHKLKYKLNFQQNEEVKRFEIFVRNSKIIEKINARNLTYSCKMNKFGHWTDEEYLNFLSSRFKMDKMEETAKYIPKNNENTIDDIDWRAKGIVTPVKDQGSCGSCWAFSTVGQIESQYAKITGKNISLSEQDLVDCSRSYQNTGCNGGLMNKAMEYIKDRGINLEKDYPYEAIDSKCRHQFEKIVLKVDEIIGIEKGNELDLQKAIVEVGPVSIAIDASENGFRYYYKGVYVGEGCSSTNINHAVLAVGIGSKPAKYYIVKNSWGDEFGDEGYILMARDMHNKCGIASLAVFSKIKIV